MTPKLVSRLFLTLIIALPLGQAAWELCRGDDVQAFEVVGPVREARLRAFERDLRDASFVHRHVSPWYQWLLLQVFGHGNEKSVVGNDGWLYFSEDLDYVSQPAFGAAGRGAIRDTIEDFGRQLEARGIALLVVPVPAKVEVQPRHLSRMTRGLADAERPSTRSLMTSIGADSAWTAVWEPGAGSRLAYLPRDTHWTPECMQAVAREVAKLARSTLAELELDLAREAHWRAERGSIEAAGDLVAMLRLPPGVTVFEPMNVQLQRVFEAEGEQPFAPEREAEVLLLGDSFTLAYSDARIGLGEHAGFAEHLALELGAPLDVIALAGGSARAVREALARREEGLAGKKLVIWQLSVRDFAGHPSKWEPVQLPPAVVRTDGLAVEPTGPARLLVRAEITEVTHIPEEFDYDFCLAVHEYRVLEVMMGSLPDEPLWVAHVAIEGFERTRHAAYEVGQRHLLELENVLEHHDLEQTSWMDNTDSNPRAVIWFPTRVEAVD